jgi:hypothetical protein
MNDDVLQQVCERLHAEVRLAAEARAKAHEANKIAPSQTESEEWRRSQILAEGQLRQQIDAACRHWARNKRWPMIQPEIAALASDRLLCIAPFASGLHSAGFRVSGKSEADLMEWFLLEYWQCFGVSVWRTQVGHAKW